MILVAGSITFDPAHQDAVVAAAITIGESTRVEDGCISFEFFADLTGPGRIHVFEEWETEAHLDAHTKMPHVQTFRAALAEAGVSGRDISRFQAERITP